jgi:hypothetical protein
MESDLDRLHAVNIKRVYENFIHALYKKNKERLFFYYFPGLCKTIFFNTD